MNKKDYLAIFLPPLFILPLDFFSKWNAVHLTEMQKAWGPFSFFLVQNKGMIFGFFANLPDGPRVIGLSTLFGFLFVLFLLLNVYLAQKAYIFKTGLSIFVAGITGNMIERISQGHVTDFIYLDVFLKNPPIFNVADIFQWVGLMIAVFGIIKEERSLWFENDARKKYLIDKKFQLNFSLQWTGVVFITIFILGIFFITFLITALGHLDPDLKRQIILAFVLSYILISLILTLGIFLLAIFTSNKTAGPLYAFERFVNDILKGRPRNFRLRKEDHHQQLVDLGDKILKMNQEEKKDKISNS